MSLQSKFISFWVLISFVFSFMLAMTPFAFFDLLSHVISCYVAAISLQIPIIMLVVEVPHDLILSSLSNLQTPKAEPTQLIVEEGNAVFQADSTCSESSSSPQWSKMNECRKDVKAVRLDISFKSPSHTGLQTTELVSLEEMASEYLWDQIQNYILLIFITLIFCYLEPVSRL